ncbi:ABC transporter substrate-binding protein [Agilicoccus flavus]|uniref:ABC transporter substrate-binding protein n=1 Tax=Agilicoccus flavus TaxID=2775968 RepID=UPI001CF60B1B|nr:extracellular solute-binding protein [Agilicoccus flavus]
MPTFSAPVSRRSLLFASAAVPALAAIAGCGPNRPGGTSEGGTALRAVWWGNAQRTTSTQQALAAFAAANPGTTVASEPTEWGGYWDKLATQLAAHDAPDLVQMDEKYLLEYVQRGALASLEGAVDTASFAPGTAELGEVDGTLYAVNAGTIAPVVMVDPGLFARAKLALPDDTTWTWDEMAELATELTKKLPDGTYGLTDFSGRDAAFRVWIRQQGADTFTNGKLGFDAGIASSFFALAKKLQTAEATPPASQSAEDVSAAVAERLFSTGRTAMAIYSSNQITAFDAATKKDLRLLRLPSVDGTPAGAKVAYQASMYWVITAESKAAAAARRLVDFLVTDQRASKLLLTERGVPADTTVLAAIQGSLSASDKKAIAYLDAIEPHVAPTPPLTPKGASSFEDVLIRHGQDVLFGRATPEAAGAAFVADMTAAIG